MSRAPGTTQIEVRLCESVEEMHEALAAINHYFGWDTSLEDTESFSQHLDVGRMHAAVDDGAIVGGAGAFTFDLSVPGGRVPAAGVTVVGVLPTHRRRGLLTQMMRAQLDDVHARGEAVAYLWASESTIYGRFGYGLASLAGEIELPRDRSAFVVPAPTGATTRIVDADEAGVAFPPIYDAVLPERPGMFVRGDTWWQKRRLFDPPTRRWGGGPLQRVLVELDGEPAAYALYRIHSSWEAGVNVGHVNVLEAMGATPPATQAIWRYLCDIDWVAKVKASLLPADHPLFLLLAEMRRMSFRVGDGTWLRVVDVEAALSARTYAGSGEIVLEVEDAFCPWNAGHWRVTPAGAERTDSPGELALDVRELGSVYLGGFTFRELADAGRVVELEPGALDRADALFRTDRAPWCPEIF